MLLRCVDRCSFQCQRGRNWGRWVGWGSIPLTERERERERERGRDIYIYYVHMYHVYIHIYIYIISLCLCVNMCSTYLGPNGLICRVQVLEGHSLCKAVLGPSGTVRWTPELPDLP